MKKGIIVLCMCVCVLFSAAAQSEVLEKQGKNLSGGMSWNWADIDLTGDGNSSAFFDIYSDFSMWNLNVSDSVYVYVNTDAEVDYNSEAENTFSLDGPDIRSEGTWDHYFSKEEKEFQNAQKS